MNFKKMAMNIALIKQNLLNYIHHPMLRSYGRIVALVNIKSDGAIYQQLRSFIPL